jgi:hypothetical protein
MQKNKLFLLVLIPVMLLFIGSLNIALGQAVYDMDNAEFELGLMAEQLSGIFGPNLGGISYIGEPIGYSIIPHFEVGISGGFVVVPIKDISRGTNLQLNFGGSAYLPIPAIGAHTKFSIKEIELGVKVAGIPRLEDPDAGTAIENIIIGGKARIKLFNFDKHVIKGGASVSGFYEYMRGNLLLTDSDSMPVDVYNDGTIDGELISQTGFDTSWEASTMGGEMQANLQLLMFNFFAGTRAGKTFGSAITRVEGLSELVSTSPLVTGSTRNISISNKQSPAGFDIFLFGGLEIKLAMFSLTGKGGYNLNNENYTFDAGFRLQF